MSRTISRWEPAKASTLGRCQSRHLSYDLKKLAAIVVEKGDNAGDDLCRSITGDELLEDKTIVKVLAGGPQNDLASVG